jgi:hypothetical protein
MAVTSPPLGMALSLSELCWCCSCLSVRQMRGLAFETMSTVTDRWELVGCHTVSTACHVAEGEELAALKPLKQGVVKERKDGT